MKRLEADARSLARRAALETLYSIKLGVKLEDALHAMRERTSAGSASAEEIVRGVYEQRNELSAEVEERLDSGWTLDRIANTDLLSLLIAVWELRNAPAVPPKVTLVEAIELAKSYGVPESGRFVHGLLASYLADNPKRVVREQEAASSEVEPEAEEPAVEPESEESAGDALPWKIRRT
jgi:N utilization substance protein B